MNRDITRLRIEKIIVHDVPRRSLTGDADPLRLSEMESVLDQELRNFFRERVVAGLQSGAYGVAFDAESESPVPALILDNLGQQTKDFVTMSRETAEHLHVAQKGTASSGLLIVMQGSLRQMSALAILKLERQRGLLATPQEHDGKVTFDIQQVHNLMLTEKTRVFKVGLFLQEGDTLNTVWGQVSDKQRGERPVTEVAGYFLRTFLGCRLREEPEVTTKRFFQATQAFINDKVSDAATKARYHVALLATLNNQEDAVRPRDFAEEHLDIDERQLYMEWLFEEGVPTNEFPKDIGTIAGQLKRIQLDFEGGVTILATPEALGDRNHVSIDPLGDDLTRVVIEDRLKGMRGR